MKNKKSEVKTMNTKKSTVANIVKNGHDVGCAAAGLGLLAKGTGGMAARTLVTK